MRAPVRPIRGRWPSPIERRFSRFFWADPSAIAAANVAPDVFTAAMSAIHVGETIKITGSDRHPECDGLALDNLDLSAATIVDMGASDGSTSIDLIRRLPDFGAYIIADLYLHLTVRRRGKRTLFYGPDGACILVCGPRFLAWPSLSRGVRGVYRQVLRAARADSSWEVLLLNPSVQELMARDPRVTYRVHDVFELWVGPTPDLIKVANLLRRLYFSDEQLIRALQALHASLPQGGHLLVVDNPRIENVGPRAGLYRKDGDRFAVVGRTNGITEIDDLVVHIGDAQLDNRVES